MSEPRPHFVASSRCECQATLSAQLTEQRYVIAGSANYLGQRESAPAHAIHPENERFDIGWLCPFCGRNVLRSFHAGALRRVSARASSSAPRST
jgi:hypothetical protein